MENIYAERIAFLRAMMRAKGWDAVVITGSDPHNSEYPAERWKQVRFLTGFTGEAGDVVVTLDHAGLWTDTRYFIQALEQLDGSGVELHRTRIPEQVLIPEWLSRKFSGEELVLALDGSCVSSSFVRELETALERTAAVCTVANVPDILNPLWPDRPCVPQTPVFSVETGEDTESKLAFVRRFILDQGADGMLISALDEIAWLLNVRGADIEYNPLVISYLLLLKDKAVWYVRKDDDLSPQTLDTFAALAPVVEIEDYALASTLIAGECGGKRILSDAGTVNYDLRRTLTDNGLVVVETESPVRLRKAVKNGEEIERMRKAHILDGVAMEKFLYWLETSLQEGKEVSEWDAAVKLGRLRAETGGYLGDSFETISAYGAGAALPHYITPHRDAPLLERHGLYLCDSGGQYYDPSGTYGGTTDITRTLPLGPCTELEKEDYTLVLKGHIALAMAVFPEGTPGCRLDVLSREPLWRAGRNFGHGTGHGVGYVLGCHEGPQDIRQNLNPQPLLPGMITSDEPGIYREGLHGVRHENLLLCVRDDGNEFGEWLRFEPLTICHFDTSVILVEMLTAEEIDWLNAYNLQVYSTVSDYLSDEEKVWLAEKTKKINF